MRLIMTRSLLNHYEIFNIIYKCSSYQLTFDKASTLGLSDSEHSVAFTNRSRKFITVGTERSKFVVLRMRLSIFKTWKETKVI